MLYKYEEDYVEQEADYSIELLKQLATIPAPSYHEEKRAQFCKQWFEERGIDAKIDKMNNVVIKMFDDNQDIAVFCSHLDVVFDDMELLKITQKGHYLYGPGVGDDTASCSFNASDSLYSPSSFTWKDRCFICFKYV